jgi:hypothetical protein
MDEVQLGKRYCWRVWSRGKVGNTTVFFVCSSFTGGDCGVPGVGRVANAIGYR